MKVKGVRKYPWYYGKKYRNIIDIYITNIDTEKDSNKLYRIFNEIINDNNVMLDFSSSHEFNSESEVLKNINLLEQYFLENKSVIDFIYKENTFYLKGIANINKEKINENIFQTICNSFEVVTFYNSNSKLDYKNLDQLFKLNKKIYTYDYLFKKDLVDLLFAFSNDGLFAHIRVNSTNLNAEVIINKLNN